MVIAKVLPFGLLVYYNKIQYYKVNDKTYYQLVFTGI